MGEMAGTVGEGVKRSLVDGVVGEAEAIAGVAFLELIRLSSLEMSNMLIALFPDARSQ